MTRDQELWGMAATLLRHHGDKAPLRVAERIGALAMQGEMGGVELWREVARRMLALTGEAGKA